MKRLLALAVLTAGVATAWALGNNRMPLKPNADQAAPCFVYQHGIDCGRADGTQGTDKIDAVGLVTSRSSGSDLVGIKLGGAYASLPTSGVGAGVLVIRTSDFTLWLSTKNVTPTDGWVQH